jgi:hypothetical protein
MNENRRKRPLAAWDAGDLASSLGGPQAPRAETPIPQRFINVFLKNVNHRVRHGASPSRFFLYSEDILEGTLPGFVRPGKDQPVIFTQKIAVSRDMPAVAQLRL